LAGSGNANRRELKLEVSGEGTVEGVEDCVEVIRRHGGETMDARDRTQAQKGGDEGVLNHVLGRFFFEEAGQHGVLELWCGYT
jgi:hypothetical protein